MSPRWTQKELIMVCNCKNCGNLVESPKNNSFKDIEHFCLVTGYFVTGIDKDSTKVKRYTPGGRELPCSWIPRSDL